MLIQTRFSDWDAILKTPAPDPKLPTTTALWHFARGMASPATGKLEDAASESQALLAAKEEFTIEKSAIFQSLSSTRRCALAKDDALEGGSLRQAPARLR